MTLHAIRRQHGIRHWGAPLLLFVAALTLYLPTVGDLVVNDSHASSAAAWRIATTGTPWMDGVDTAQLRGTGTENHATWLIVGADGHAVHGRTAGSIIPAVPFYWALNNEPDPQDFEIAVGGVAASTLTAIAGVVLFFALRTSVSEMHAFVGSAAVLFASPAWSVSANALWTHNLTLLGLSLAMLWAARGRWFASGISLGLGILSRPHLAVIAAVVGVYLAWSRREWRIVPTVGVSSALGLVTLMAWNRVVFGTWSVAGGYASGVTEKLGAAPGDGGLYHFGNVLGFLAGPDRGFFVWTPVAIVLLPSVMAAWKTFPDWVRAFALGGIAYSSVQLVVNAFHGGEGIYGYRLALELLLCITPALVHGFVTTGLWTRVVVGILLGVQAAVFGIGAVDEDYYVDVAELWTSNAYLVALADHPIAFGGITAFLGLAGGGLMYRTQRRTATHSGSNGSPDPVSASSLGSDSGVTR